MKYRAIAFDLDNTLYCEAEYRQGAYRSLAMLLSRDFHVPVDHALRTLTSCYERNRDVGVFQAALHELGVPATQISEYVSHVMVPEYRSWLGPLTPYPWVYPLLDHLRSVGIRTGLITNGGSHTQWNKIRLLRLDRYFDKIVVTGDHFAKPLWKPHAAPFELCFERLVGTFEGCLYIGDDPVRDVTGPRSLGIDVILVGQPQSPLFRVSSLSVEQIIECLHLASTE